MTPDAFAELIDDLIFAAQVYCRSEGGRKEFVEMDNLRNRVLESYEYIVNLITEEVLGDDPDE